MRTNFEMMTELLKVYKPKTRGIVTMTELYLINEKLHMDEMNELQLRNLRDFTVLFLTKDDSDMESWDKMSAITTAIDQKLFNMGAEV